MRLLAVAVPSAAVATNLSLAGSFCWGGYTGDFEQTGTGSEFNDVWELRLLSHPKKVSAVCHGCGKFTTGLKVCSGTCGGAVAACGMECLKKVWEEGGHKVWCKKQRDNNNNSK